MKEKKQTNPKIKLALAIAVPLMVMVVTIAMVGASFAWFSESAVAEISTISLTTKEVFTLVFAAESADTIKYQGETAMAETADAPSSTSKHRYLICDYRARGIYNYSTTSAEYGYYMQDAPFMFKTTVRLDTDDKYVDMNIDFDTVKIYHETTNGAEKIINVSDSYGENIPTAGKNYTADKIPLGFTWYMVKNGSTDNIIYTPYGIMEYEVDGTYGYKYATKLNGEDASGISILNSERTGLKDFYTNGPETYDIYVVFCPEEFYWMQYFAADRDRSLDDVYTSEEISLIVASGATDRLYYSLQSYWGSTFEFAADMKVSRVDWERSVSAENEG